MSSVSHSRRRTVINGTFLAIIAVWITAAISLFAQTRQVVLLPASESGRRLALVIGNRDYTRKPLSNPINDASDLAKALKQVGFEATLATNVDRVAFEQTVRDFANVVRPGDVALFYFSGHGMEVDGQNYLLPVNFDARSVVEVKYQAQPASLIQELLQEHGARVVIVVLDACRDNPYRTWRSEGGGGLSAMSGRGVYVAFAAAPGRTADDNAREHNGRFTKHLLEAIVKPGLSIDDVFNEVRAGVSDETGGVQVPFSNSGLIGRFVFREAAPSPPPAPVAAAPEVMSQRSADLHLEVELSLWQSIKDSKKIALFENYLRRYPEGQFAEVAKDKIEELRAASALAIRTAAPKADRANLAPAPLPSPAAQPAALPAQAPAPKAQPAPAAESRPPAPAPDTTAQDWEAVKNSTDRKLTEAFLQRHPTGPLADTARTQLEQMDWSAATGSNDRSKLQEYLSQHNGGRHAPQAREQIEQIDWNSASGSHDRARIQGYLDQYRDGRFNQQAREALEQIDWDAVKESKDVPRLQAFLNAYPDGHYMALAKAAIDARANAPRVPPLQVQKHPDYCPLPDRIEFDNESEYRDKLGIWTGFWEKAVLGRRFCIVLTSIKAGKARAIYSAEDLEGDGWYGGFYAVTGKVRTSTSSIAIAVDVPERKWQIVLEFRKDGRVQAGWTGLTKVGYHIAADSEPKKFDGGKTDESKSAPTPVNYTAVANTAIDTRANAPRVPPLQVQKRPDYCPLPEQIDFDNESEHPDKLGIWTGTMTENYKSPRRFCLVLSSIKNGRVRGVVSYEYRSRDDQGGFFPVEGSTKFSSGSFAVKVMRAPKSPQQPFANIKEIDVSFQADGSAKVKEFGINSGNSSYVAGGQAAKMK